MSAADPVVTEMKVDRPDRLTVGDRFRYVIKVEADRGASVFLAPGGLPDVLALSRTPSTTTRALRDDRVEITLTIDVAAFVPGNLTVPPLRLRHRAPGGAATDISTPPSSVNVVSVLPAGEAAAPKDLKPQAEIGTPPVTWLYAALAAAVIALIVVVALLLWRRAVLRRRVQLQEPEAEEGPDLGPEDRARRVLDAAGRDFAAAGDYVRYYGSLAVTVRNYLTERYGFAAFALTTRELQGEMVRRGIDRWQARLVSGLLTQCDAAVYAGYRPAHERADADLTAAYEIVEMSRPQPPVVEVSVT
jgi:hypothetical protein